MESKYYYFKAAIIIKTDEIQFFSSVKIFSAFYSLWTYISILYPQIILSFNIFLCLEVFYWLSYHLSLQQNYVYKMHFNILFLWLWNTKKKLKLLSNWVIIIIITNTQLIKIIQKDHYDK